MRICSDALGGATNESEYMKTIKQFFSIKQFFVLGSSPPIQDLLVLSATSDRGHLQTAQFTIFKKNNETWQDDRVFYFQAIPCFVLFLF